MLIYKEKTEKKRFFETQMTFYSSSDMLKNEIQSKKHFLIVGAGLSGLSLASVLLEQGQEVTILDKSRGIGGRMATRKTISGGAIDHGVQYFSAKSPIFKDFLANMKNEGVVTKWTLAQRKYPRFIGTNGMKRIAQKMAENMPVHTAQKVVRIEGKTVLTQTEERFTFDELILTIPVPQALELLKESQIPLEEEELQALTKIEYDPCLAVLAVLTKPTSIPTGGIMLTDSPVAWLADNFQKGITTEPTLTLHASGDFSRTHLETVDLEEVGKQLLESVGTWVEPSNVLSFQVHRWRYSLARQRYPKPFMSLANGFIHLAGDAFGSGNGNVEGAFLSGYDLGNHLCNLSPRHHSSV